MMFIYVYYRLFACTNLVDVIQLFFTVFLFNDRFSEKFDRFFTLFARKSSSWLSIKVGEFSANLVDNLVNSAEFWFSSFFLILSLLRCVSVDFFRFSPNFSEFYKIRRIWHQANFHAPSNFQTLPEPPTNHLLFIRYPKLQQQ
jgi:hypothetical protein